MTASTPTLIKIDPLNPIAEDIKRIVDGVMCLEGKPDFLEENEPSLADVFLEYFQDPSGATAPDESDYMLWLETYHCAATEVVWRLNDAGLDELRTPNIDFARLKQNPTWTVDGYFSYKLADEDDEDARFFGMDVLTDTDDGYPFAATIATHWAEEIFKVVSNYAASEKSKS